MTSQLERLTRAFATVSEFTKVPLTGPTEMDISKCSDEQIQDVMTFITFHAAQRGGTPNFFTGEDENHRPRLRAFPQPEPEIPGPEAMYINNASTTGKIAPHPPRLYPTEQSASESIIAPQPLCEPKLRAEMERLGMEKFSKVFCNVLSEEKEVLNPEELFRGEEFKKVYMKHLRAFHLAVYREFLPQANQYEREQFALIFSVMLERDLPKGKILDVLSRTK